MITDLYDKGTVNSENSEKVSVIAQDAANEAKKVIADGFTLMTAFVKYCRGSNVITKRAEIEAELNKLDKDGEGAMTESDSSDANDLMNLLSDDSNAINSLLADDSEPESSDDSNSAVLEVNPGETVPNNLPPGVPVEVTKSASLNTKEGRAMLRAKLAADATGKEETGEIQDVSKQKFSDMLDQADKLADGQTELDTKPSDSLGLVETLSEANKAMLDLAKAPPKVRKEAEAIQRLVSQGKLDRSEVDALVAQGLDKDAVAYWKHFYGQVDGGSEFASELVKEHAKAELEAELNKYRVKLARSYELVYDMVDRGLCHNERSSKEAEVDRVMKMNDEGFDSLKRIIAKSAPLMRKEAGRIPQVGIINSSENMPAEQMSDENLFSELSAALSSSTRRMF
jgi:hypothetical protein